jgi:predicted Zn-dependent protease
MPQKHSVNRRDFLVTTAGGTAAFCLGCTQQQPQSIEQLQESARPDQWNERAKRALDDLRSRGVDYADIRLLATRRQTVRAEDQRIAGINESFSTGYGIRALHRGAWGFAAGNDFSPDHVRAVANRALEVAKASHLLMTTPVKLAGEPVHKDRVKTPRQIDPFNVSLDEKANLLLTVCDRLHEHPKIKRSHARLWAQHDRKLFASTEGTSVHFDLLAVGAGFRAVAPSRFPTAARDMNTSSTQKCRTTPAASLPRPSKNSTPHNRHPGITISSSTPETSP